MPFEIIPQNDYVVVKMTGQVEGLDKPPLAEVGLKFLEENKTAKNILFQCSDCGSIGVTVLREMAQIYKQVLARNGIMRLQGCNDKIVDTIKKAGMDRILVNRVSIRGALVDFGIVKAKEFDVNFINPFLSATQKVFKIQAFLEATPKPIYLKKPTDPLLMGDISGIISISSETFNGTLAISLTEKIFLKVVSNMLGENVPAIKEENVDLVGELANMILGQAKIELSSVGYGIQMALPSCVWGKDHKIKHYGGGRCIVVPFETAEGIFYTEIMTSQELMQATTKIMKAS